MMKTRAHDENRIAEEIVSVLPAGIARECSSDRGAFRYAVRAETLKLRTIVLSRSSLRRLAADPQRAVKIEYLQRDLLQSAERRSEFRYPHPVRLGSVAAGRRRIFPALPFASMI